MFFASLAEFNSYTHNVCGEKEKQPPLHSLAKFQLCLDVPLALALCFAPLDSCRNVIPQQTGLVWRCYLPAWKWTCLGISTCCKFQVLIKKIHWSLDNISSLQNSFLFMPIFFLFDGNLLLGVQILKVGMILFVFILICQVQLLKSFGNYVLFPEFRQKEMFTNKYTIKLLICISEIIWRKRELKFLPIGSHL